MTVQPESGMQTIVHIAIIVPDIEAALQTCLATFGVTAPVSETGELAKTDMRYYGEPTEGRAKLAFVPMGAITIEFIEPIGGPSIWRDQLEQHGASLHHIAFVVPDMQPAILHLEKQGMKLVQQGNFVGGSYAYNDARHNLGAFLELLQIDKP